MHHPLRNWPFHISGTEPSGLAKPFARIERLLGIRLRAVIYLKVPMCDAGALKAPTVLDTLSLALVSLARAAVGRDPPCRLSASDGTTVSKRLTE